MKIKKLSGLIVGLVALTLAGCGEDDPTKVCKTFSNIQVPINSLISVGKELNEWLPKKERFTPDQLKRTILFEQLSMEFDLNSYLEKEVGITPSTDKNEFKLSLKPRSLILKNPQGTLDLDFILFAMLTVKRKGNPSYGETPIFAHHELREVKRECSEQDKNGNYIPEQQCFLRADETGVVPKEELVKEISVPAITGDELSSYLRYNYVTDVIDYVDEDVTTLFELYLIGVGGKVPWSMDAEVCFDYYIESLD